MFKITIKIDGMMCGMCESHINDAVRRAFNIKKVTSSHKKGETIIISDTDIKKDEIEQALKSTGYRILSVDSSVYEKKGLFGMR